MDDVAHMIVLGPSQALPPHKPRPSCDFLCFGAMSEPAAESTARSALNLHAVTASASAGVRQSRVTTSDESNMLTVYTIAEDLQTNVVSVVQLCTLGGHREGVQHLVRVSEYLFATGSLDGLFFFI